MGLTTVWAYYNLKALHYTTISMDFFPFPRVSAVRFYICKHEFAPQTQDPAYNNAYRHCTLLHKLHTRSPFSFSFSFSTYLFCLKLNNCTLISNSPFIQSLTYFLLWVFKKRMKEWWIGLRFAVNQRWDSKQASRRPLHRVLAPWNSILSSLPGRMVLALGYMLFELSVHIYSFVTKTFGQLELGGKRQGLEEMGERRREMESEGEIK